MCFFDLYFHIRCVLQEEKVLEEKGGNVDAGRGRGTALMSDLGRVRRVAVSVVAHKLGEVASSVVLRLRVWAHESGCTDLNRASTTLFNLSLPQLHPLSNEDNHHLR